jgi:hypothetical protein
MARTPIPHTPPAKRRRTKAERAAHAFHARQSVARKQDQDLCRTCLWIPRDQKEYFQQLAAEARARHLARLAAPVGAPKPPSSNPGRRRKPANDTRQGELPL